MLTLTLFATIKNVTGSRLDCLGFGFLLSILLSKVRLAETVRLIVGVIAGACFLTGFVLAAWAKQEAAFLNKPDPEEHPKIIQVMVPKLPISGLIGPSTQNPRHWRDRVVSCSFVIMCDVESDEAYMASSLGISFCRAAPNASPTINQFAAR